MENNPVAARSKNPLTFLREVQAELKKVDWPTRQQTARFTGIVIFASVVVALYLGGLDFLFTLLLANLVK